IVRGSVAKEAGESVLWTCVKLPAQPDGRKQVGGGKLLPSVTISEFGRHPSRARQPERITDLHQQAHEPGGSGAAGGHAETSGPGPRGVHADFPGGHEGWPDASGALCPGCRRWGYCGLPIRPGPFASHVRRAAEGPGVATGFARLLLEHRAAVNLSDDAGRSALSLACERGYLEVIKLLVQFGADPDTVDSRGWSPLMYASSEGRTAVVEWLLRAFRRFGQLRLERADRAGHTALQLAASGGHHGCVRALRSAGALLLIFPSSSSQAGDDHDGAASAASPPLRAVSERQLPLDERSAQEERFQGEEEEEAEEEDGLEPKKEPSATRGRPLIRRSTAPDCQSLLSH
ncbi:hypothetical protein E2320_021334, partial [Naja naja]